MEMPVVEEMPMYGKERRTVHDVALSHARRISPEEIGLKPGEIGHKDAVIESKIANHKLDDAAEVVDHLIEEVHDSYEEVKTIPIYEDGLAAAGLRLIVVKPKNGAVNHPSPIK